MENQAKHQLKSTSSILSDITGKLKSNFLFQASLGSKELFHSNMLAFLLEQKSKNGKYEALMLFLSKIVNVNDITIQNESDFEIRREENNIDLTIKLRASDSLKNVFLENKFKSIPTSEQLLRYAEVIDSEDPKILLTPLTTSTAFISENFKNFDNKKKWLFKTYSKDIIAFLRESFTFEYENDDIKIVIQRYICFLELLMEVLAFYQLDDDESFKKRYFDFYLDNSIIELRKIRIHDFVLKLAHSKIEVYLRDALDQKFSIARYETAFTDSKGLSTVEIQIRENYFIGIQIQGNQFRYFTRTDDSRKVKINEKFAVELFNKQLWFYDLDTRESLKGKGRDKSKKYKNYGLKDQTGDRSFCEYFNGAFVYLYKELNQTDRLFTVNDIIELVVRSLKQYKANEVEFKQILQELNS